VIWYNLGLLQTYLLYYGNNGSSILYRSGLQEIAKKQTAQEQDTEEQGSTEDEEYGTLLTGPWSGATDNEEENGEENINRKKRERLAPGVGLETVPRFAGLEDGVVTRSKRGQARERERAKPSLRGGQKVA